MSRSAFLLLLVLLAFNTSAGAAPLEKRVEKNGACVEAKVMASPALTYEALRAMRDVDPEGCRVLSTSERESVVEEVFDGLPLIGQATCVYRETYEPGRKLSFKMIRSDRLKAFEGEWTLQPIDKGEHTLVNLRSYIDTGIKVPFARQLTDRASAGELKEQLADLKKAAELKQKNLAEQKSKKTI
jgi:hypothetical protein